MRGHVLESRAFDAHPSVVEGGVRGLAGVEDAGRLAHAEGVGVLVQHVGGDGRWCTGVVEVQWFDREARRVDLEDHTAASWITRALPGALCRLGGVPGRSGRTAPHQRVRGEDGGVSCPPREHNVGTLLEGLDDGFVTQEADDVRAAAHRVVVEWPCGLKRMDASLGERGRGSCRATARYRCGRSSG